MLPSNIVIQNDVELGWSRKLAQGYNIPIISFLNRSFKENISWFKKAILEINKTSVLINNDEWFINCTNCYWDKLDST